MDLRSFSLNVLPDALVRLKVSQSHLAFRDLPLASRDLLALSGGHDFLLQASNAMCAETAFASLDVPWLACQLDTQAVAALRASGATFTSPVLERAVAASISSAPALDVLLLFSVHDVVFDGAGRCRVRVGVRVALGRLLVLPREPGLQHGLSPGEAIERVGAAVSRVSQALLVASRALAPQPIAMHTLSSSGPAPFTKPASQAARGGADYSALHQHLDLGNRSSFEVEAWLSGGLLEIPAPFAATGDRPSATIRIAADASQSTVHYTGFSGDSALLLSDADPLGLVLLTTQRVRQRARLALVDDLSLVGGPAAATVGHLDAFEVEAFPCRTGSCSLNVGATIVPGRFAARAAVDFIGSSRFGVLWSADAVKLLVRFCWEAGSFPRSIMQVQAAAVKLKIDGVVQFADAISDFHLDTLEAIELQYDSNAREDILYTRGSARVLPKLLRLSDGRELGPKDPGDKLFAPSEPTVWEALGTLTDESLPVAPPDVLLFESTVTRGVTARLGRPFTNPSATTVVNDSRISAPAQRVALLAT